MTNFDPSKIRPPHGWAQVDQALERGVTGLVAEYAVRRSFDTAISVLEDILPAAPFWLYGAGTHTAALLQNMPSAALARVRGIIDAYPEGRTSFSGQPVVSLADYARAPTDCIFVAHPAREGEMIATLLGAGVAAERLTPLYQHPAYAASAARALPELPPGPIEAVIVGETRFTILTEDELACVFDAQTTPYLGFEWHGLARDRPPFHTIDLQKSLNDLAAALRHCRPRLVYLRAFTPTNFLAYFIRQILPDCVLIHELWDFTVLLEDDQLADALLLLPESIEIARLADLWSVSHSDLVISKRGGTQWPAYAGGKIPSRIYYAGLGSGILPKAIDPQTGSSVRLVYAGILPRFEDLPKATYDYTFVPLMQEAVLDGLAQITIFNSAHNTGSPTGFEEYRSWFAESGIIYEPRIDYEQLLRRFDGFDYGWMAIAPRAIWDPDKPVVVPARLTGYITAGLPVIVNEPFSFCVELVREFEAGIVLEEYSLAGLREALGQMDIRRHRAGALRLKEYMVHENRKVLTEIARLAGQDAGFCHR